MANLYDLTGEALRLNAALDGELTPEEFDSALEAYNANMETLEDKLDGYARIIRNLSAFGDACKAEEDRLSQRRKSAEAKAERMREAVRSALVAIGREKCKTSIGTWTLQKGRPSVNIVDPALVPQKWRIPQPDVMDKRSMLEALKGGTVIPGAEKVDGQSSLVFR